MRDLVIIGAGGFGRVVLDVAEAAIGSGAPFRVLGIVDDDPSEANLDRLRASGVPFLGDAVGWLDQDHRGAAYLVGVGAPTSRESVARRFDSAGIEAATLVHPRAVIGGRAALGPGTVICAGAQVSTDVRVGRHVHVNPGAIIGHDVTLEDFVSVNPGSIVSGEVLVERGSLIGAGAVVLQGLRVGSGATVGAAACVVRDVEPGSVVKGVPAR